MRGPSWGPGAPAGGAGPAAAVDPGEGEANPPEHLRAVRAPAECATSGVAKVQGGGAAGEPRRRAGGGGRAPRPVRRLVGNRSKLPPSNFTEALPAGSGDRTRTGGSGNRHPSLAWPWSPQDPRK